MPDDARHADDPASDADFLPALRKGVLLGVAILVIAIPPLRMAQAPRPPATASVAQAPVTPPPVAAAPAPSTPAERAATAGSAASGASATTSAPEPAPAAAAEAPAVAAAPAASAASPGAAPGVRLADFGGEQPSPQARHVADWVVHSRDHKRQAFVIVDKAEARVYVFTPDGKLRESAPALLGSARGDDTAPGVGDKPLSQVKPHEKTTPAGRFVAQPGKNTKGEDIIWVDYAAAVSLHRIRPLVAADRRLERLATLTVDDNRISYGCINLPVSFYEEVLSPTVRRHGAIVYVLPETRTPQKLFGSYDVPRTPQAAPRKARAA